MAGHLAAINFVYRGGYAHVEPFDPSPSPLLYLARALTFLRREQFTWQFIEVLVIDTRFRNAQDTRSGCKRARTPGNP